MEIVTNTSFFVTGNTTKEDNMQFSSTTVTGRHGGRIKARARECVCVNKRETIAGVGDRYCFHGDTVIRSQKDSVNP